MPKGKKKTKKEKETVVTKKQKPNKKNILPPTVETDRMLHSRYGKPQCPNGCQGIIVTRSRNPATYRCRVCGEVYQV